MNSEPHSERTRLQFLAGVFFVRSCSAQDTNVPPAALQFIEHFCENREESRDISVHQAVLSTQA